MARGYSNRTGINTPSQAEYDLIKIMVLFQFKCCSCKSRIKFTPSVSKDTENTVGEPTGKDSNEPTILIS